MAKAFLVFALLLAPSFAVADPTCAGPACAEHGGYGAACENADPESARRTLVTVVVADFGNRVALLLQRDCHSTDYEASQRDEARLQAQLDATLLGVPVFVRDDWREHEQTAPYASASCSHALSYRVGSSAGAQPLGCTSDVSVLGTPPVGHVGPNDIPSLP